MKQHGGRIGGMRRMRNLLHVISVSHIHHNKLGSLIVIVQIGKIVTKEVSLSRSGSRSRGHNCEISNRNSSLIFDGIECRLGYYDCTQSPQQLVWARFLAFWRGQGQRHKCVVYIKMYLYARGCYLAYEFMMKNLGKCSELGKSAFEIGEFTVSERSKPGYWVWWCVVYDRA